MSTVTLAHSNPSTVRAQNTEDFFERKIRPVLIQHCYKCHSAREAKPKGGLRLDTQAGMKRGGDSGPAITPGKPDGSLLMLAIRHSDDELRMPPKSKLPAQVINDFEKWIAAGAVDPRTDAVGEKIGLEAARSHWAFEPLSDPKPPAINETDNHRNPIDRFVDTKLVGKGLLPLDRADKRTLIRRASFDLTGLPPSPEDVEAFVKAKSPDAFARLIDRLLASKHYGERWGRHWLDVVRYADTAGETADFPLPEAWRYRNYVIDAFNKDKPYDKFVQEQLAGDLMAKQLPRDAPTGRHAELVTATGYIAIARRFGFDIEKDHFLTIDDTVDTLGKSLLGLTIGCARCHHHKYDPIRVEDYYSWYGIFESTRYPFSGCEKTKVPRDLTALTSPTEWQRVVEPFNRQRDKLESKLKTIAAAAKTAAKDLGNLADKDRLLLGEGTVERAAAQKLSDGAKLKLQDIQVKAGQLILLSIDPRGNHGADSTKIELTLTEVGSRNQTWDVTKDVISDFLTGNPNSDRLGNAHTWSFFDLRDGMHLLHDAVRDHSGKPGLHIWRNGDTPSAWVNATDKPIKVWTTLPPKTFFIHPAPNGAVGVAWLSPIDGRIAVKGSVADAHGEGGNGVIWRLELFRAQMAPNLAKLAKARTDLTDTRNQMVALDATKPNVEYAYAVTEGKPHDAEIHLRGDPDSRGAAVPRRNLLLLGGRELADKTISGRLELAQWITASDHPLTARVMVNRIWQHHFGVGLVGTPNNFGLRGESPTHPQLLDYLARYFIEHDWSIKSMHRLIMSSEAYQRTSVHREDIRVAIEVDPGNRLLWRFTRRRLSAEEIRDAILTVSSTLDRTPGRGHPFPPASQWGFTQHTPFNALYDHNKRSVYLMTQRLKRHPYLSLFDGADTASSTGKRHATTVPTQALFFMNNQFVHENAAALSARLLNGQNNNAAVDHAFSLLFARPPKDTERDLAKRFIADYKNTTAGVPVAEQTERALAAWLRIMMSSNEFLYVD